MLADGLTEKVAGGWDVLFLNADIFKSESLVLLAISHHDAVKGSVFHVWLGQYLGQDGLLCLRWTINNMPCAGRGWQREVRKHPALPVRTFASSDLVLFFICWVFPSHLTRWHVCEFELNRGACRRQWAIYEQSSEVALQLINICNPLHNFLPQLTPKKSCFYVKLYGFGLAVNWPLDLDTFSHRLRGFYGEMGRNITQLCFK